MHARHLRGAWFGPRARLGVVAWPATWRQRLFVGRWHYWWQAHLLDCLLDAQLRAPTPARRGLVERLVTGIRGRNLRRWTNDYYDDVAWMGLALQRAESAAGVRRPGAVAEIIARLRDGWTAHSGGGIWWRHGDDFKNVPANGPAAILLARSGVEADRRLAAEITEWMSASLVDGSTGLVWDGLRVGTDGAVHAVEKAVYSYCQGVYLGACVELAAITGQAVWLRRAARTVSATVEHLVTPDGVLRCHGTGDGGLFTGILARYLALAAAELPATELATSRLAARLVITSAEAAWRNRAIAHGGPRFTTHWSGGSGGSDGGTPAPDLSVQLSAWMLLEAAASLERRTPALI